MSGDARLDIRKNAMLKTLRYVIPTLILLVFPFGIACAQVITPKRDSKQTPSHKAETYVVSKSPFKVEIVIKGVFEAEQMSEVVLRPEVWSTLVVKKAVRLGKHVKQGESLLVLETKKIDEELNDLVFKRQLSLLGLKQAEDDLHQLQESQPFELKNSLRAKQVANDNLKYFLDIDLDVQIRSAKESLKQSEYWLENAQEELKQLEQMYKADDLTEETEEIILKRAHRSVESAKFRLEVTRHRTERTLKTTLPREEEQLRETVRKQTVAFKKAESSLPRQARQKELKLEKLVDEKKKLDERFKNLKKDRENLVVKSPANGIVYYGSCVRGKWSPMTTLANQFRRGRTLSANQVCMTIVQYRPIFVRANLPEKELQYIRRGVTGRIIPTAFPNVKLGATIDAISPFPIEAGIFDTRIRIDLLDKAVDKLMPGMACTIKFVTYRKKDALTVPTSAVFSDELDEDRKFVYLAIGDAERQKQRVVVGNHRGKKVEILKGLNVGDEILLKKPL